MKSFRILGALAAVGALLLAATASAVERTTTLVLSAGDAVWRGVCTFAAEVVRVIAPKALTDTTPAVRKAQAKAFVQRLAKRERPVVTSSWRMCPST